jgi:hypothetical protein
MIGGPKMNTNKLIVITEEYSCVVTLTKEMTLSKDTFIALAQRSNAFKDTTVLDVVDANIHHICKYCGDIANGTDENVLCSECRELFGHAFYSEL